MPDKTIYNIHRRDGTIKQYTRERLQNMLEDNLNMMVWMPVGYPVTDILAECALIKKTLKVIDEGKSQDIYLNDLRNHHD